MVPNQEKTNPALKKARNKGDGRWMWKYILHQKLPEYVKQGRAMLSAKSKVRVSPADMARAPPRHIFEFGHQINAFGLLSVFLQIFPNNTKVMRLRRAHCEVIESFKHNTMCPAYWSDNKWLGVHNCPGDPDSLFKPPQRMWKASKLLRTMVVSRRSGARVARGVEEISKACVQGILLGETWRPWSSKVRRLVWKCGAKSSSLGGAWFCPESRSWKRH